MLMQIYTDCTNNIIHTDLLLLQFHFHIKLHQLIVLLQIQDPLNNEKNSAAILGYGREC